MLPRLAALFMGIETTEESLIPLVSEPSLERYIEPVLWKGIPIELVSRRDRPIYHAQAFNGALPYASFWHSVNSHEAGYERHTLWLSANRVPGYVMIADGLEGDSFSLNGIKRGDKRFFQDYWRNCLLLKLGSIKKITIYSAWKRIDFMEKPGNGDMSFHVVIHHKMRPRVREQPASWGSDCKLVVHDKVYYTIVQPKGLRVNRKALVVG